MLSVSNGCTHAKCLYSRFHLNQACSAPSQPAGALSGLPKGAGRRALVHVDNEVQRPPRDPRLGEHPDDVEAVPGVDACVRPHITEVADHFLALSTSEACEGVRICAKGDGLKGVHERYGRRCETNCNLR